MPSGRSPRVIGDLGRWIRRTHCRTRRGTPMPQKKSSAGKQDEIQQLRYELGVWKRLLAAIVVAQGKDHGDGIFGIRVSAGATDAIEPQSQLHDIPAVSSGQEMRYVFFSRKPG